MTRSELYGMSSGSRNKFSSEAPTATEVMTMLQPFSRVDSSSSIATIPSAGALTPGASALLPHTSVLLPYASVSCCDRISLRCMTDASHGGAWAKNGSLTAWAGVRCGALQPTKRTNQSMHAPGNHTGLFILLILHLYHYHGASTPPKRQRADASSVCPLH